jgi:hypothetical protein
VGVVIVAPATASWPRRALAALGGSRLHVAWVHDLRPVGALIARGGVRAIAVDATCRGPAWATEVQRLQKLAPAARILVVRDDGTAEDPEAITWPGSTDDAFDLLAVRDPTA